MEEKSLHVMYPTVPIQGEPLQNYHLLNPRILTIEEFEIANLIMKTFLSTSNTFQMSFTNLSLQILNTNRRNLFHILGWYLSPSVSTYFEFEVFFWKEFHQLGWKFWTRLKPAETKLLILTKTIISKAAHKLPLKLARGSLRNKIKLL